MYVDSRAIQKFMCLLRRGLTLLSQGVSGKCAWSRKGGPYPLMSKTLLLQKRAGLNTSQNWSLPSLFLPWQPIMRNMFRAWYCLFQITWRDANPSRRTKFGGIWIALAKTQKNEYLLQMTTHHHWQRNVRRRMLVSRQYFSFKDTTC